MGNRTKNVMEVTREGRGRGNEKMRGPGDEGTRGRGDKALSQVSEARPGAPIGFWMGRSLLSDLGGFRDLSEGEQYFEGAALAGFAGYVDLSVVFVDDAPDE